MHLNTNIYPPVKSNFEDSLYENHRQVKHLQTSYLSQQYQKNIQAKRTAKQAERRQKQFEMSKINQNNEVYINHVNMSRDRKFQEMHSMSNEYQQAMENKRHRESRYKQLEKQYEKTLLKDKHHKWMRSADEQRQIHKQKMSNYNHLLQQHVRQQQFKKSSEKTYEEQMKQRINSQAEYLLNKQYQELEAQSRRRSLFEQRQNALLGINTRNSVNLNSSRLSDKGQDYHDIRSQLHKNQRELYKAGLQKQLGIEEQRKKQQKQDNPKIQKYNPITNPIPFIYKNPNVLRMMASGR